jgi:hypothetical protein
MKAILTRRAAPAWLLAVAALGAAWNLFGVVQLYDFVAQTRESLMMKGMSPSAAELYYGLPGWMKVAFAVGSIGGLAGSVALIARPAAATPILAVSLVGYVALFAGDLSYGVFDVIEGQIVILSTVLAIAAGLLAVALVAPHLRAMR